MAISYRNPTLVSLAFLLSIFIAFPLPEAANTITTGEILKDGDTILSPGENFVLGFFNPANSNLRYLGIWYKNIPVQTIVWVANRENPISDTNGYLAIKSNLMILDGKGVLLWSSNASVPSQNSTASLSDTGNLVLSSSTNTRKILWQSFQNPTDTYLPGMTLQLNAPNGENHIVKSWKSSSDPSMGDYSSGIDTRGTPQIVTWHGSKRIYRSGHWNGLIFLGIPSMRKFPLNGFKFVKQEDGRTFVTYTAFSKDPVRFYLWWNGSNGQLMWDHSQKEWRILQLHPAKECEKYNKCGNYGICSGTDTAICGCIKGFKPKNQDTIKIGNWSDGCIRKTPLKCVGDKFLKAERIKLPDFADVVGAENKEDCQEKCLKNCSCTAYAFVVEIRCMTWSADLVDVQQFSEFGETLYIRLDGSELGGKTRISTGAIIGVGSAATVLGAIMLALWRRFGERFGNKD